MDAKRAQQELRARETREDEQNSDTNPVLDKPVSPIAAAPTATITPPRAETRPASLYMDKPSKTNVKGVTAVDVNGSAGAPTAALPSSPTVRHRTGVRFATSPISEFEHLGTLTSAARPLEASAAGEIDRQVASEDGGGNDDGGSGGGQDSDSPGPPRSPSEMPQPPVTAEEAEMMEQVRRQRTPSPYDPRGPRPSQRVRDAEVRAPSMEVDGDDADDADE